MISRENKLRLRKEEVFEVLKRDIAKENALNANSSMMQNRSERLDWEYGVRSLPIDPLLLKLLLRKGKKGGGGFYKEEGEGEGEGEGKEEET